MAKKASSKKAAGKKKATTGSAAKKVPLSVDDFVAALDHPLKAELEVLRSIVQTTDRDLVEVVKWNAPSFQKDGEDRITFNLSAEDEVRLVLHRGAKAKDAKKKGKLIADQSGLLEWPADDRAVARFSSMTEIDSARAALRRIIKAWLAATRG